MDWDVYIRQPPVYAGRRHVYIGKHDPNTSLQFKGLAEPCPRSPMYTLGPATARPRLAPNCPDRARKGTPVAHPAACCVGCGAQARPRPVRAGFAMQERWGNRRRRARRIGAAAALERRTAATLRMDEVSSEVSEVVHPAMCASRDSRRRTSAAGGDRPGDHRRRSRRSSRRRSSRPCRRTASLALARAKPEHAERSEAERMPASMSSMVSVEALVPATGDARACEREPDRERGAKRARGRRCRRDTVCAKINGPRRRRNDDAARDALRSMQQRDRP